MLAVNVGGSNDFSTANVGTLLAGLSTASGSGLQAGSIFAFDTTNATAPVTYSNVITDSTGTGGGAVGIAARHRRHVDPDPSNTYTGLTTVSSGTLQLGNGGNGARSAQG